MTSQILDGKMMARRVLERVREEVSDFQKRAGRPPSLTVVRVGDDPASRVFVGRKMKACAATGITASEEHLSETVSLDDLCRLLRSLNQNPALDGILVQLPLPSHLPVSVVTAEISPAKDVDGFTPANMGRLTLGTPKLAPCTPLGVVEMLRQGGISVSGKHAVIVGRSSIVGKPLSLLLLHMDATVTLCHSRTPDLDRHTRAADILVVAAGRPGMIKAHHVKEGAVVIDVGINRIGDKLLGDVAFDEVSQKASALSPVPGGVGPMTVAMVCRNTVLAAGQRLSGLCDGTKGV
ncbi:MAG: bifunctional methylenetetrahydrofolate dehydrogenase/methenyltetrahydrofolate cyclohydrolase FolD [Armatimonadetes bacterium]|nr:bifunctional methylenetetrahydrofolate dehydrogenase/methenyltetrahydrofolate cyclohydrolase FolD [Armatimonadota bacterium]